MTTNEKLHPQQKLENHLVEELITVVTKSIISSTLLDNILALAITNKCRPAFHAILHECYIE